MRDEADADAGGGALGLEPVTHLLGLAADLLGNHERSRVIGLRKQDQELVAAVAIRGVHGANRPTNGSP